MCSEESKYGRGEELERALAEFYDAWFAGEPHGIDSFVARHPECGPELRFELEDFLFVAPALDPAEGDDIAALAFPLPVTEGRVIGDFRIAREIGRGGMGIVYEAEQISLRRSVALKILPSHLSLSDDAIKKFRREAEAGARQAHPGIVSVHGVGEIDGTNYIAQELVPGGRTLADRLEELQSRTDLPVGYFRETARLFAEVADSLQHAHDSGVIHRDVKPSNILLTTNGKPKITDFGLAKVEDALALSRSGDFAGTPYYMSPEQVGKRRGLIDHRTDVFSLGVSLYEALTLRRPFDATGTLDILKQVLDTEPADPRRVSARVPRDLALICLKAMEKEPARRYPRMGEFAADLRRYLNGEVILARPTGAMTRSFKWARRHRTVTSLSLAAIVLVLLLGILALFDRIRTNRLYGDLLSQADRAEVAGDLDRAMDLALQAVAIKPDDPVARDRHKGFQSRKELEAVRAEFNRTEALLLADHSAEVLEKSRNAGLALALAVEAGRRNTDLLDVRNALSNALALCRETNTLEFRKHRFTPELLKFVDGYEWNISFFPDGKQVLLCNYYSWPEIWDVATGRKVCALQGHDGAFPCGLGVLSSDATMVAEAAQTSGIHSVHLLKVWSLKNPGEQTSFSDHGLVIRRFAFSHDCRRIAMTSDDGIACVYSLTGDRGPVILSGHDDEVWAVAFNPSDDLVATGSADNTARIWDAETGESLMILPGHEEAVDLIAFSPDGSTIVTTTRSDFVRLWAAEDGRLLHVLESPRDAVFYCDSAFFTRDSRRILTAHGGPTASIWDVESGEELVRFEGHTDDVRMARFSPSEKRVITASFDKTARVWDAETGNLLLELIGHDDLVDDALFSPDGRTAITISCHTHDHTARLWDVSDPFGFAKGAAPGRDRGIRLDMRAAVEAPDWLDVDLSAEDFTVRVHDRRDSGGTVLLQGHGDKVNAFCTSLDPADRFATGSFDGSLRIWNSAAGQLITSGIVKALGGYRSRDKIHSIRFHPDGERIFVSERYGTLRIYDAATGINTRSYSGHTGRIYSVHLVEETGLMATASEDETARVWNLETDNSIAVLSGHEGPLINAVLSGDGQHLATVGDGDRTVRVWDVGTALEILTIPDIGNGPSCSPCFSKDGTTLLLTDTSGSLQSWPLDVMAVAEARLPRELTLSEKEKFRVWSPHETEALEVVRSLFDELILRDAVIAAIENDPSLSDGVRMAAIGFARMQEDNPALLRAVASENVFPSSRPQKETIRTYRLARAAYGALPRNDSNRVYTYLRACFQMNKYEEVIALYDELEQILAQRGEACPHNVFRYLALSHQRLGNRDAAEEALERYRTAVARDLPPESREAAIGNMEKELASRPIEADKKKKPPFGE